MDLISDRLKPFVSGNAINITNAIKEIGYGVEGADSDDGGDYGFRIAKLPIFHIFSRMCRCVVKYGELDLRVF